MNFQNNLANFSFLSLLIATIFYWIGTSFNDFSLNFINLNTFKHLKSNIILWFSKNGVHFDIKKHHFNIYEVHKKLFLLKCYTSPNLPIIISVNQSYLKAPSLIINKHVLLPSAKKNGLNLSSQSLISVFLPPALCVPKEGKEAVPAGFTKGKLDTPYYQSVAFPHQHCVPLSTNPSTEGKPVFPKKTTFPVQSKDSKQEGDDSFIYSDTAKLPRFRHIIRHLSHFDESYNKSFLISKKKGILNKISGFLKATFLIIRGATLDFNPAFFSILIANILLSLLLILRWVESGHFPLSNLYESLMFLSWCFTVLQFLIIRTTLSQSRRAENNNLNLKKKKIFNNLIGSITTPCALLTNAFATFNLPKEMQEVLPLVPALQSNWLMMHVTVMILSYAALILGSLLAIAYLIVTTEKSFLDNIIFSEIESSLKNIHKIVFQYDNVRFNGLLLRLASRAPFLPFPLLRRGEQDTEGPFGKTHKKDSFVQNISDKGDIVQTPTALTLDNLSYRIVGIGFPLLTIGILSGAVWANEAWGTYWSWDPKETWAFLTWLIYAIYLHSRISKGWAGKKPAIIASFGFIVVWICYLGVNLIGEGLHSYGWLS